MNIPSNISDEDYYKNCKFVCECGHEDCRKIFPSPMSWIKADDIRPDLSKFVVLVLHPDCMYSGEFESVKILDGVFIVEGKK